MLRPRRWKGLVGGHTASQGQCLDQNLGLLAPSTSMPRVGLVLLCQTDKKELLPHLPNLPHLGTPMCGGPCPAGPSEKGSSSLPRGHP